MSTEKKKFKEERVGSPAGRGSVSVNSVSHEPEDQELGQGAGEAVF